MSVMPVLPDSATRYDGQAPFPLRYEDICSDGRLMIMAMPTSIGALWRSSVESLPILKLRDQGTIPILAQLWIEGTDEPIHLSKPVRCQGTAALAHTRDASGEVNRLLLDINISIFGSRGRFFGPAPAASGEEVLAGKVYARHVFSKPFAKREERRVRSFDTDGLPSVPALQMDWSEAEDFSAVPAQARALDEAMVVDPTNIAFGLHHCDSNQHVNSLVYPRLFEDACQRRFSDHGIAADKLARQVAISYRKPFFAGQQASARLQGFSLGDELGAVGAFYAADDTDGRPHSLIRMNLR
jgi:hypothetical protein